MFKKIKENLLKYFTFEEAKAEDPEEKILIKVRVSEAPKIKRVLTKDEKLKIKLQIIPRRTKSIRIKRKNLKRLIDVIFEEIESKQNDE